MFILKNVVVFLIAIVALCGMIISFNFLGFNRISNLVLSAAIFSLFITLYFKELKICLILFSAFFGSMLLISLNIQVLLMFITAISVYFVTFSVVNNVFSEINFNKLQNVLKVE